MNSNFKPFVPHEWAGARIDLGIDFTRLRIIARDCRLNLKLPNSAALDFLSSETSKLELCKSEVRASWLCRLTRQS
jgi:hypothetical protein